jgi:hypothetical protein
MSARQMIDIAAAAGIRLAAKGEKLIADCDGEISAASTSISRSTRPSLNGLCAISRFFRIKARCQRHERPIVPVTLAKGRGADLHAR